MSPAGGLSVDVAYGRVFILHFYGLFYNVGLRLGRKMSKICPSPVLQLSGCPEQDVCWDMEKPWHPAPS